MTSWNIDTCRNRVRQSVAALDKLEVTVAKGLSDLDNIPLTQARIVDGVHVYVELANAAELLNSDKSESERSHRRLLRYLHLFARAANWVLLQSGSTKVDLQNKRLHFVVLEPTDDEKLRCQAAVAISEVLRQLVVAANDVHPEISDAKIAVGIESGQALAIRNGTRGDREPLFLGHPANRAAHLLSDGLGLHLGERVSSVLGVKSTSEVNAKLVDVCLEESGLGKRVEGLLTTWKKELKDSPLASFKFSVPTLPLSGLDLDSLSPANSRRSDWLSVFADIDGFSNFVSTSLANNNAKTAAIALHVIRKELRDALRDFGGRKVRYHGDCLQGVVASGSGTSTDQERTTVDGALLAGALNDAFQVICDEVAAAKSLGLQVGVEAGPISLTRLGVKGSLDRCSIGNAVFDSERLQAKCSAGETMVGVVFLSWAPDSVSKLFVKAGKAKNLTYNQVYDTLAANNLLPAVPSAKASNSNSSRIVLPRAHTSR